jgi:hypothetical protein
MNRRGAVHTLDAFFAAAIIATALLYATGIPIERGYMEDKPLEAWGIQALVRLDGNGTLGRLVDARGWEEMERALRIALPVGVSFNVTVFDERGSCLNDRPISNGGLVGRTVKSIEYPIAAVSGACPFYRLRLQLGG